MPYRFRAIFFLAVAFAFFACRQPGVREIPISNFFKTPEESLFRVSPDGKFISYLKAYGGRQNVFIRSFSDTSARRATSFTDYSVREYSWTYHNQIVFVKDVVASDEYKIYVLDANTLQVRNLLSLEKGRIRLVSNRFEGDPDVITIAMNKRDPANFDIYKLNIKTGELTPYLVNPGNITEWFPDDDGRIRLVKSSDGVDETILYRPDDDSPFQPIIKNNFKNRVQPIAFINDKHLFYALSNVNQDKTALVVIDATTG
ncbi:MAG: hypothetical protein JST32_19430, partial [Bacteroidetes bacterium]|nr:hypothetical protein [Bacteroidota bacterium]